MRSTTRGEERVEEPRERGKQSMPIWITRAPALRARRISSASMKLPSLVSAMVSTNVRRVDPAATSASDRRVLDTIVRGLTEKGR